MSQILKTLVSAIVYMSDDSDNKPKELTIKAKDKSLEDMISIGNKTTYSNLSKSK